VYSDDEISDLPEEIGSDELLSDDNLRLPESADILVRLHAVRAWLARRRDEAIIAVGEAALSLQQVMISEPQEVRSRRRERQDQQERISRAQQALVAAQQSLKAYEEAQVLLEECVAHASGERILVEYYLVLEELVQKDIQVDQSDRTPWLRAMAEVQHRIERVGVPNEEE